MTDTADKPSLKDIADKDKSVSDTSGAPGAQDAESASEAQARPKSGGGFMWVVLLLVVMGGAVAAGWPYLGPRIAPILSDARGLLGLNPRPTQARLPSETSAVTAPAAMPVEAPATQPAPESAPEAVAEAVSEADPALPAGATPGATPDAAGMSAPDTTSDPDGVAQRLDAMQLQLDALGGLFGPDSQAKLDSIGEVARALADVHQELVALSGRLQALEESTRADPTAPAQALVLGVTQLRARLTGDSPFTAELTALEHIAGKDAVVMEALQRLRPHAEVGIPSEAALTARFAKVAKAILTARSTSEAGGWLATVKASLGGLVTVRRTDPARITDEVERAVAVAEAALELGELGEAVKALSALQGAPGDAVAAWLGDASARVGAEAALEDLHSHALSVLSSAGGA